MNLDFNFLSREDKEKAINNTIMDSGRSWSDIEKNTLRVKVLESGTTLILE